MTWILKRIAVIPSPDGASQLWTSVQEIWQGGARLNGRLRNLDLQWVACGVRSGRECVLCHAFIPSKGRGFKPVTDLDFAYERICKTCGDAAIEDLKEGKYAKNQA